MARGGARPNAGRPKGQLNKATADIKALARQYVPEAIVELARLSTQADSEQARVSAIKELFDRAYGKSTQHIAGDDSAAPVRVEKVERIIVRPPDPNG